MNEVDIKRLRREAELDLEALKRVEAMLSRDTAKSGGSAIHGKKPGITSKTGVRTGLKSKVVSVMEAAGSGGMRTKDVAAALVNRGYVFKNPVSASASVSTALTRLKDAGFVEKTENGYFVWIGKDS